MKNKILLMIIGLIIASCGNTTSDSDSLVKKRIYQKIDASGMGLLKDINIESVVKINDTIYTGIHSFTNPMIDKEVRLTRNYTFSNDLDSIVKIDDIKSEMKSEGEWVKVGF